MNNFELNDEPEVSPDDQQIPQNKNSTDFGFLDLILLQSCEGFWPLESQDAILNNLNHEQKEILSSIQQQFNNDPDITKILITNLALSIINTKQNKDSFKFI